MCIFRNKRVRKRRIFIWKEDSRDGYIIKRCAAKVSGVQCVWGVFFFINVSIGGVNKVPLIHLIDNAKAALGLPAGYVLVMVISLLVLASSGSGGGLPILPPL